MDDQLYIDGRRTDDDGTDADGRIENGRRHGTDDGTDGRTERDDGKDDGIRRDGRTRHDGTNGQTTENGEETDDRTDGRTEDDDGDDGTGRMDNICSESFKYDIGTNFIMSQCVGSTWEGISRHPQ